MKNSSIRIAFSLALAMTLSTFTHAQDSAEFELSYEVKKVYPSFSVTKDSIQKSKTLKDIKYHYETSWIKDYLSVETSVVKNGNKETLVTKDDILTEEQKKLMLEADNNSEISISIKYIPQNTLKDNQARTMDFNIAIDPAESATFPGGNQKLRDYLKTKAINKVADHDFRIHHLTAVEFSINENGDVVEAKVSESSSDKEVDQALLNAICDMPRWSSAKYSDGTSVIENYVLLVGDQRSCVQNFFNTRHLPPRG